jgi:hypothetical protein
MPLGAGSERVRLPSRRSHDLRGSRAGRSQCACAARGSRTNRLVPSPSGWPPSRGTRTRTNPTGGSSCSSSKRRPKTGHLSWGFSPLHRHTELRPTRDTEVPRTAVPTTVGRHLWFLTTWAACSAAPGAGLLHPAAGHGVHRLSGSQQTLCCQRPPGAFPPVLHPPKKSAPDSRTASPRPFPPRRSAAGPTEVVPLASTSRSCSIECSGPCQLGCPP